MSNSTIEHRPGDRWTHIKWRDGTPDAVVGDVKHGVVLWSERGGSEATGVLARHLTEENGWRHVYDVREERFVVGIDPASGPDETGIAVASSENGRWVLCAPSTPEGNEAIRRAFENLGRGAGKAAAVLPMGATLTMVDPRAAREARRREIDAVLREDARRFPAFATARRCAVMARAEALDTGPEQARSNLASLHLYENMRGGQRTPSARTREVLADAKPDVADFYAAYERARAL